MPKIRKPSLLASTFLLTIASTSAYADSSQQHPLSGRAEVNTRFGNERSITMTEFWAPFTQDHKSVLYGDIRLMGDTLDNHEGNLGIGYREITDLPILGHGIAGVNGWIDRRITSHNSTFHQVTLGTEWLGDAIDLRANAYIPLSNENYVTVKNDTPSAPELVGNNIYVDTDKISLEAPLHGFDLELGTSVPYLEKKTDSFRVYGGGYYFNNEHTDKIAGLRTRAVVDVTPDLQFGARVQYDNIRKSQGFLELTLRFPFGQKQSYQDKGLWARMDESPERDIDIVTEDKIVNEGKRVKVLNKQTGQAQQVIHVDNTAAGGGNGSAETPYNTLAAAEFAAPAHSVIYVHRGDGTRANQDQGILLSKQGQQLIGTGEDFYYDSGRFSTANGASPTSILIAPATSAPTIGNVNAGEDGVRITANDITVTGLIVDNGGTGRDGIVVEADGATASATNISIQNVTAQNARIGIYIHGTNDGSVSAKIQNSITTSNSQHGIAVYDDTNGTFTADLGGGPLGSIGNNILAGNTLEDLAVDYDGRTLFAKNNWWGQASGEYQSTPAGALKPQIYYGAPINDGLIGHWTFDTEWTTNTTAYDRSSQSNDGSFIGDISLADQVTGHNREALAFTNDKINAGDINALDGTTEFTITSWIKLDDTNTDDDIFAKGSHTLNQSSILIWRDDIVGDGDQAGNTNTLSAIVRLDGATHQTWISAPSNSLNDTGWHHIAVTYKANDITGLKIYIDGVSQQTGDTSLISQIWPTSKSVNLGGPNNDIHFFDGSLDSIATYTKELTSSEISEIYRMNTSSVVNTGNFLTSAP